MEEQKSKKGNQIISGNLQQSIVILSAKDKERLYEQVQRLIIAIEKKGFTDRDLNNICYTLQVGREHMEYRLAFLVTSIEELKSKLNSYLKGEEDDIDTYYGTCSENSDFLRALDKEEELREATYHLMQHKKYGRLLEFWTKGLNLDWSRLYEGMEVKPHLVSLPTYPFAREKYWAPGKLTESAKPKKQQGLIHPLIHENTSNLMRQRFSAKFSGQEKFIDRNHKTLNELTYLEMARVASEISVEEEKRSLLIKDVNWYEPIIVDESLQQVHIALYPNEQSEIEWEVYGQKKSAEELVVSGEGKVSYAENKSAKKVLNWEDESACCVEEMDLTRETSIIEKLYIESDKNNKETKLLVQFKSQDSIEKGYKKEMVIDPTMLWDCIEVVNKYYGSKWMQTKVLNMKEMAIESTGRCSWGIIKVQDSEEQAGLLVSMALCDRDGNVLVHIEGLRCVNGSELLAKENPLSTANYEQMIFEEVWEESALNEQAQQVKTMLVLLSDKEMQQQVSHYIEKVAPKTKVIFEANDETGISLLNKQSYMTRMQEIKNQYEHVDVVFYLWPLENPTCVKDTTAIIYMLQALSKTGLKPKKILLAGGYKEDSSRCYVESWIGIERSIGMVMPGTAVNVICMKDKSILEWIEKLWQEFNNATAESALYEDGFRKSCKIKEVKLIPHEAPMFKKNGVYVITGGAGGLGKIFSEYLAKQYEAQLVLLGRSKEAVYEERIKALQAEGVNVRYIQADVCDAGQMKEAIRITKEAFGHIDGVIHAAGIEGKGSILEKDITQYKNTIAPKIQGTLALEEACQGEALDFICYFSSSAAIIGDFGNCDYAVGNRFLMSYVQYCNRHKELKKGKRIVVNWPLWKSEGMGFADDNGSIMYLKSSGQRFIEAKEGTVLLDEFLRQERTQHLVLIGERERVYRFLKLAHTEKKKKVSTKKVIEQKPAGKGRKAEMKGWALDACVKWDLKDIVSRILTIARDKLDLDENLAEFGFDSISLAELSDNLSDYYELEVTPDVFFAYPTLGRLGEYLLNEYTEELGAFYKEAEQVVVTEEIEVPSVQNIESKMPISTKGKKVRQVPMIRGNIKAEDNEPIAIIGMSGRFPDAWNVEELWAILEEGRDVVREVPKERKEWWQNKHSNQSYLMGIVPGMTEFDPLFFEISPREAEDMDPRQRLLLEETWKALEDAGYGENSFTNEKIGMFVGVEDGDYKRLVDDKASITSNNNAVLAARLSYFLNLSGPNMAINTACSSGLVGVHEACMSIRNGECDTAIVAGANLMVTPDSYNSMAEAGMLAEDGKCYAFDKRASGMVPAEAIAVVVLKKLSKAEKDHNPIYATILGSGINYDGKTNGITAPSGRSQSSLLKEVYSKFKIDPTNISYIVTHGTGTKLGDPIEINALAEAFKGYTVPTEHCALTSTKANFGHALAASGVVSLISLVMAIKKSIIPPSIHCEQPNDYIHWKDSPFYINREVREWKNEDSKERIGGVSAFGMSGTNVHVVVQSYTHYEKKAEKLDASIQDPYYLLTFSAKTKEALQRRIEDMISLLEKNEGIDKGRMAEISYTLMSGRKNFSYRYAFVAQDREDAIRLLKQAAVNERIPNIFRGKVSREFVPQVAVNQSITDLMAEKSQNKGSRYQEILCALAEFYCMGYEISGNEFFAAQIPYKVSLPTYSFEREKYWVTHSPLKQKNISNAIDQIHPLVHKNTSDLTEQRYTSYFTGEEFFLRDHVINGNKLLPGVAYLEMVRAAVQQAITNNVNECIGMKLTNIGWFQPIVVGEEGKEVNIVLYPESNGEISYQIYTESDTEDIIHSEGSALLTSKVEIPDIDLEAAKKQCTQVISLEKCYETFNSMKMTYGVAHRGIEKVYVGEKQAVVKLTMPQEVISTHEQYVLHPSMMDGALQAIIGFIIGRGEEHVKPSVPFAMEGLEIYKPCTSSMWGIIKDKSVNDKLLKYDLDLCNENGGLCIRIKGYTTRVLEEKVETRLMHMTWKEGILKEKDILPKVTSHNVIFLDGIKKIENSIYEEVQMDVPNYSLALSSTLKTADKQIEEYATNIFTEIKKALKDKKLDEICMQVVISNTSFGSLNRAILGMLKTAQQENPKFKAQLIEVNSKESSKDIAQKLKVAYAHLEKQHIRFVEGKSYVPTWDEVSNMEAKEIPWKDQGVYLITGGSGGLGLIFAKEIANKVKQPTIVLTGRSKVQDEEKFKEIKSLGAKVQYWSMDVTEKTSVQAVISKLKETFGKLNGIIHSAGVVKDAYIINKTQEEFEQVLAPKVTGLVNLDEMTKDMPLDFLITFSSVTGSLGNPGQVDYAVANKFMDEYANYRNTLVSSGKRFGKTLAISWPLWREGGMHIDQKAEKILEQSIGVSAIETRQGIKALYEAWNLKLSHIICLTGNFKKLQKLIEEPMEETPQLEKVISEQEDIESEISVEQVANYLKKTLAEVIKLPVNRIDIAAPMEEYGIDSLMVMQLTNQLENVFGTLPKTLFFEYQTIKELSQYFLKSYKEILSKLLKVENTNHKPVTKSAEIVSENEASIEEVQPNMKVRRHIRRGSNTNSYQAPENEKEEIAIVGMAGKYPKAENLAQFWENLRNGVDCVTEIPKERWDADLLFNPDKNNEGTIYCKWGGFLDGVNEFDPLFFNISPREAEIMEPQERLFLECVYATLEDAGYTPEQVRRSQGENMQGGVGVYVGVMYEEYQLYGAQQQSKGKQIALSGNPSSIANRVSYYFNFNGPSMAIDTMCSSSLTSMHLACNSIRRGECEVAIAGGVNVSVHPNKYVMLSQGKFASSKGRCESFGEGGDGYVPGEGVGAIMLKKLSKAIQDGDHIYGVIKETTINHGGKTNGYTVPNPNAQSALITKALKGANINPRTISYVEAHGTGTSLGDPIEIAGLNSAFSTYTSDKQFCAIGSAKANIGHCESAAGIAGVTKVLLQMQHGEIVPSIHSKILNPYIDFKQTPFVVQQELTKWQRPLVEEGGMTVEYPRRAGISAFGAGGSNAHIIIEEYKEAEDIAKEIKLDTVIIILSAKTKEGLRERAKRLRLAIPAYKESDLPAMAYTLQLGREEMEYRVGFTATNLKELERKLEVFLGVDGETEDIYEGHVKKNPEVFLGLMADEDMEKAIETWGAKGKYDKLINLWVKGMVLEWNKLYGKHKMHKISLPTYPFAKEQYWVPDIKNAVPVALAQGMIHPFVGENTSDLLKQRFTTKFTGEEDYLEEINGTADKMVPEIVQLEMARVSSELSMENIGDTLVLKEIFWYEPIKIEAESNEVHIALYPESESEVSWEVYSKGQEEVISCEGKATYIENTQIQKIDLIAIKDAYKYTTDLAQIDKVSIKGVWVSQTHEAVESLLIEFGEIQDFDEEGYKKGICLNPLIFNRCLQVINQYVENKWKLNLVSLDEVHFSGQKSGNNILVEVKSDGQEVLVNMSWCNEDGIVLTKMIGLRCQVKMLDQQVPEQKVDKAYEIPYETMTFSEDWQEEAVKLNNKVIKTLVMYVSSEENIQFIKQYFRAFNQDLKLIFITKGSQYKKVSEYKYEIKFMQQQDYIESLKEVKKDFEQVDGIMYLCPLEDEKSVKDETEMIYMLQGIAKSKLKVERVLLVGGYSNGLAKCYIESWIGIERSVGIVMSNTKVNVVCLENKKVDWQAWSKVLWDELKSEKEQSVWIDDGSRKVCGIKEVELQENDKVSIRQDGVYLITGGMGGLGKIFTQYLANTYHAKLILVGRSTEETKKAQINELKEMGAQVIYVQADVCDLGQMREAVHRGNTQFGRINGVIHAAGLDDAGSILTKEIGDYKKTIAPKVTGTLVLQKACEDENLDFICYFSSSSAIIGDFGNCDYAVGNRFLMSYANYYNNELSHGTKAIVINWPLWKSSGMGSTNESANQMYLKTSGQKFMEANVGTILFERLLKQVRMQHLVIVGQRNRVYRFLGLEEEKPQMAKQSKVIEATELKQVITGRKLAMRGWSIGQCIQGDVKEQISQILKIPKGKLDSDENLAEFGFDSVTLAQFANNLSKYYTLDITPDILYGYPTIEKLSTYLETNYTDEMATFYKEEEVPAIQIKKVDITKPAIKPLKKTNTARLTRLQSRQGTKEQVAIIGMSGRFPDARSVEELWDILLQGKEVINEVPKERKEWWKQENVAKDARIGAVPGIAEFDPLFFEIAPSEAEDMDPRQRLLLEEAWKALEDAGYGKETFTNERIGMFVGVEDGDYKLLTGSEGSITSNHNAVLAARLAYLLNLDGPNMAINTACSSGLVAVHEAYLSIQNGECDTAIVAAANLMTTPEGYKGMKSAGMLSKDGKCYAFDKRASGMIPAEAIAVVVLKRLSKAQADKNPIYATIVGSGINYDGKTNGITAPSGQSQTKLLKDVYERAHINPTDISYIVTHGTGTKLGDPMEINALADVFKGYSDHKNYCAITSNKPNIGHALAASGVVSLISLAMALKTETIPASINCEEMNDYIHWENSPFYINTAKKSWTDYEGKKRLAGVSSFGMSGTNVHVVLQSYEKNKEHGVEKMEMPYFILTLSAKTPHALKQRIQDMINYLEKNEEIDLSAVSYTLMAGRMHFNCRVAIVVRDREDATEVLKQVISQEKAPNIFMGQVARSFTRQAVLQKSMEEMANESLNVLNDTNKYQQILYALGECYCQGYDLPYELLFEKEINKVTLPTYPFDNEEYWTSHEIAKVQDMNMRAYIHPLIHENISDLSGQCFSTKFTNQERFFETDGSQKWLSEIACLEMARVAIGLSTKEKAKALVLEDIKFNERIVIDETLQRVCTAVYEMGQKLSWEIYAENQDNLEAASINCEGNAIYIANRGYEKVDLISMRNSYEKVEEVKDLHTIESVWEKKVKDNAEKQVFIKYSSNGEVLKQNEKIVLSVEALIESLKFIGREQDWKAGKLIDIDQIEIASDTECTWACFTVKASEETNALTIDAQLYDEEGNTVACITGLKYVSSAVQEKAVHPVAVIKENRKIKQVVGKGRRLEMKGWTVEQCILWELKDIIHEMLKIPSEKLDIDENLGEFGFDSISLSKFADKLSGCYEVEITPDIFYAYPTIERLSDYLYTQYKEALQAFYQEAEEVVTFTEEQVQPQVIEKAKKVHKSFRRRDGQSKEPIAIIGMSGRFPDAWNVEELWSILLEGREVIHEMPKERIEWWQKNDKVQQRPLGVMPGVDEFDPLFFEISPREAENMDPRQRILLEETWKALEDAGYGKESFRNEKIGMFVGVEEGDYRELISKDASITSNHNAVLAARLSYFLNLNGPNMAINTACSSGLVAVHEACLSLRNGECDTAIVAAANLMIMPDGYDCMAKSGMLSKSGRCYAFDKRADGMIPAEAVAVVVLKRLSKAETSQNPIYAKIIADGINYDGKTNGITAPSGQSQTQLLKDVYENFNINPRDISYIVTHGTGTKLGDPIEINALAETFKDYSVEKSYCALTSTKPNIGHALAASGVISLMSLAMALKKEMIPGSINCEQVNNYIHWEDSPFYINQKPKTWHDENGKTRLGGVSAFGMSGTNVHLVLEGYTPVQEKQVIQHRPYYLLVFSAKTQEALYASIKNMIHKFEHSSEEDLQEISYTLLAGRMQFNYRCAVVIRDYEDAIRVLRQVESKQALPNLFKGVVARDFVSQNAVQESVRELVEKSQKVKDVPNKYQEILYALAEFYCMGYEIAYKNLFDQQILSLVNLPTYSFAKEKYWVAKDNSNSVVAQTRLHELVHENTSEFTIQRFTSNFTGKEPYFDENELIDVAHLEMVQAAMALSMGEVSCSLQIQDVVWHKPILVVNAFQKTNIAFSLDEEQVIHWEIYEDSKEQEVNSEGIVTCVEGFVQEQIDLEEAIANSNRRVDLEQYNDYLQENVQEIWTQDSVDEIAETIVIKFARINKEFNSKVRPTVDFNTLLTCLRAVSVCDGINRIGKLISMKQMDVQEEGQIEWAVLHIQKESQISSRTYTINGDLCDEEGNIICHLEELVYLEDLGERTSKDTNAIVDSIDVADSIEGKDQPYETMTFEEVWEEQPLITEEKEIRNLIIFSSEDNGQLETYIKKQSISTEVIVISQGEQYEQESKNHYTVRRGNLEDYIKSFSSIKENFGEIDDIIYLWPIEDEACIRDQSGIIYILQGVTKASLKVGHVMLVGTNENSLLRCYEESWIGIERSTKLVMPKTKINVICIDQNQETWRLAVWQELHASKIESACYEEGHRKICKIHEVSLDSSTQGVIRQQGTYLITGGLGGLGMIFSTYLAKNYHANLILINRSEKEKQKEKIERLERAGAKVLYVQANVCDLEQVERAVAVGASKFNGINGIIHAAGLEGKGSILQKDMKEYCATMAPKIEGTLALSEACKNQNLDFICYFSSSSAIIGDFGNCDYAVGNRFLMSYARYYNSKLKEKGYTGKATVVNWPLWKSDGMGFADEAGSKMYLKSSGQRFIEAEEGTVLLEELLKQSRTQHLILIGQRDRVYRFLNLSEKDTRIDEGVGLQEATTSEIVMQEVNEVIKKPGKGRKREMKGWSVLQCIEWDVKGMINKLLKVPTNKIDENENLAEFGFDSISLAEFAEVLSQYYSVDITPDIFYGYPTIEKLGEYLYSEYNKVFEVFYEEGGKEVIALNKKVPTTKAVKASKAQEVSKIQKVSEVAATKEVKTLKETRTKQPVNNECSSQKVLNRFTQENEIAIIGMSGRFPDARNTEELWSILSQGKEVIHEVTKERIEWWQDGKGQNRKIGEVPGIAEFDSFFFEISPREAESMDPRQRLLLQETWKALEDAGYGKELLKQEKIGMFVGVEEGDYKNLLGSDGSITSNHNGVLAARLSYFLNFDGPNMAINTACSSGLVAVHEAALSLRSGECDTAIVAAANLMATPVAYDCMKETGMLGKDGKCYAFDKRADGMIPAEAVAVVVLKRLSKAEADGNPIYATIVGSGINYDGRTNGITAPSGKAQAKLLKEVYSRFNINPKDISYIVTHGTGTKLGDPIEINALTEAFKESHTGKAYCALTSTKPNIGHALAASGIVSFISLVLALKNETIPASINCEEVNDYIHWEDSPFYLNHKNKVWKDENNNKRLAGVSAFGMSGTNVHVVVQSYAREDDIRRQKDKNEQRPAYLLAFSAKTQEALQSRIRDAIDLLEKEETFSNDDLAEISYTLMAGRQHFSERCCIVARDKEDALWVLKQAEGNSKLPSIFKGTVTKDFSKQITLEKFIEELIKQSYEVINEDEQYQDKLNALAEFYCLGYEIPIEKLFDEKLCMVNLPTYPFLRKKHWIGMRGKNVSTRQQISDNPVVSKVVNKELVQKESQTTKKMALEQLPIVDEEKAVFKNTHKIVLTNLQDYEVVDWDKKNTVRRPIVLEALEEQPIRTVRLEELPITPVEQPLKEIKHIDMNEILVTLAETLASELYIEAEDIDYDKSFTELGLDSIIGVEWIRKINKKYEMSISTTKIYQYPNLLEFAKYIAQVLEQSPVQSVTKKQVFTEAREVKAQEQRPKVEEAQDSSIDTVLVGLATSLAQELYIEAEDIDYDKSFTELGLDSIIGVEWIRTINKQYGVNIGTTKIYQYPNLMEFAKYVISIKKNTQVNESKEEKLTSTPVTRSKKEASTKLNVNDVLIDLATSLASELYIDLEDIDYEKSFTELGLDSIIGVEWIRNINKKYGTSISTTKIYQYANLNEFANYLLIELTSIPKSNQQAGSNTKEEPDMEKLLWEIYQGDVDISDAEQFIVNQQEGE